MPKEEEGKEEWKEMRVHRPEFISSIMRRVIAEAFSKDPKHYKLSLN